MKKIKIAVIDTGIDIYDDEIKNNIFFDKKLQIMDFEKKYKVINDIHGHGTLCAKTILGICKDAIIYPVKIFNNNGLTSSLNLVEALEKILYTDINIINISASTMDDTYEKEMENICNQLYSKGKIIICSQYNSENEEVSIPTKFKTVLGVKGLAEIFKDEDYFYNPEREVQIYANSKDKLLLFENEITHFGKNSRAAAVFSGIVGNFIKNNNFNTNQIENLISKNAIDLEARTPLNNFKDIGYDKEQVKIAKKIVTLINHKFAIKKVDLLFLNTYSLQNNFTNISKNNVYEFLVEINKEFKIHIDYRNVFIYELEELSSIIDIIQKNK